MKEAELQIEDALAEKIGCPFYLVSAADGTNVVRIFEELIKMGFSVIPSKANFIFAETDRIDGEVLYNRLRERNILTRHFKNERIRNFVRISIGTKEQMDRFLLAVKEILEEK